MGHNKASNSEERLIPFIKVYALCLFHWKYDLLDTDSRLLTAMGALAGRHQSGNDVDIELLQMVLNSIFEVPKCKELSGQKEHNSVLLSNGLERVEVVATFAGDSDWKNILDYRKRITVVLPGTR